MAGWWHARYFLGYARRGYRCGLLLLFQGGIFEGSLFVEILESESEEETLSIS